MIFYYISNGRGAFSYVLPHQLGREQYFDVDRAYWLIPGTFEM